MKKNQGIKCFSRVTTSKNRCYQHLVDTNLSEKTGRQNRYSRKNCPRYGCFFIQLFFQNLFQRFQSRTNQSVFGIFVKAVFAIKPFENFEMCNQTSNQIYMNLLALVLVHFFHPSMRKALFQHSCDSISTLSRHPSKHTTSF